MSTRRPTTRRVAGFLVASALLALPAACGDGEPAVSDVATAELQPRTDEIRLLATAGRPEEALARLEELRLYVADLQARDEITDDGADDILERADALATELQQVTTTTTVPPTTQPPPPPPPDEERGNGNGNGNGREREDREERDD